MSNIDEILMGQAAPVDAIKEAVIDSNPALIDDEPLEHEPESNDYVSRETSDAGSKETKEKEIEVDDYGTEIKKVPERVYTETEVNQMIRDRLARGKQQPEPQYQPAAQPQPQSQSEGDESWEQQLESFVENTLSKREQKLQEQRWQQQEQETQTQFEIKFNQGASKYNDFEQVVSGKPLTPQMVIATRGMEDPAAFIYAAAKTQANELDRISKVNDPYQQAIELGRLEERMRKARGTTSRAPAPLSKTVGDVAQKPKLTSIDDKIRLAEQSERQRRGGR